MKKSDCKHKVTREDGREELARNLKSAALKQWSMFNLGDQVVIKKLVRTQSNRTKVQTIRGKILFLSAVQAVVEEKPWKRHSVLFNDMVNPNFRMGVRG